MGGVHFLDESHILLFLLQIFVLLSSAKLLGLIFSRLKQPTVTADILVGIIWGPTIIGRLFPNFFGALFPDDIIQRNMLETIAWTGILLLLLSTGLEVNFSSIWKQKKKAAKISSFDIFLPMIISGIFIYFLPSKYLVDPDNRILFTVFLSTIMTISALPVAIRAMKDMNLLKTDMGFLVISCLSINDIIGWMIFTIVLGIFSHGSFDIVFTLKIAGATLLFTVAALTAGRHVISFIVTQIKKRTHDNSGYALTAVVLTGLAFGAMTQRIGIHALFGFFIAGMIAGEAKDLSEKTRTTISHIVHAVFVPLFFVNIGLKFDILANLDLFLVAFMSLIGIIARFLAAYIGTIFARTPRQNRATIAVLHTPGGEMHIVISTLAVELGLITQSVYVAIIAGAIISSIILGPWLSFVVGKRYRGQGVLKFSRKGIIEDLGVEEKFKALEILCASASDICGLEKSLILNEVSAREELVSTALEEGIAVPHARMKELKKPVVVFGKSETGIDWDSPDGKPSQLVFLILTPQDDVDMQIQILSFIARSMSKVGIRELILKIKDYATTKEILEDVFKDLIVERSVLDNKLAE
ncbi:cation:proton antiporter [candidate division WOR-3 bacterium]|nr:cation:proton antiporter [candidate division WOR-3 bacterium]